MHDNIIGNFVTIAPRAVLLGRVIIEDCVFIGANATILPNVIVGRNSIVGAGAVVTKDVPHNTIARGVPARFYKKND
jgi:acetyltransferase-like isoleucine patch superfamily enzyme